MLATLREEWLLAVSIGTMLVFFIYGRAWFEDLTGLPWLLFLLLWLVGVMAFTIFAVVRHADVIAARLGEPLGTLVLTLVVTGIESIIIVSTMFAGSGNDTLARDSCYAVVMIVLNGMVGLSLLLGGLRHHEQTYNLQGANAFLALIVPLAALALILPNFTDSTPGPGVSPLHAVFLVSMSIALYAVFLAVQNVRHRQYFISPGASDAAAADQGEGAHSVWSAHSTAYHALFLAAYFVPLSALGEEVGTPLNAAIRALGAPSALGGVLVAALVLAPESVTGVRAALANHLQRSVNLLLGSVLATISLTIPAVLCVGLLLGKTVVLGLDAKNIVLLVLTLVMSAMTFATSRTNVLQGAVHVLLFFAYVMLIFDR
jgi:Ca2+:H+ antiporter